MEKIPSSCKHFYLDLTCWYAAIFRYTLCPAHISTLVLTFKLFLNFAQSSEGTTFNLVSYKRQDSSTKYGLIVNQHKFSIYSYSMSTSISLACFRNYSKSHLIGLELFRNQFILIGKQFIMITEYYRLVLEKNFNLIFNIGLSA